MSISAEVGTKKIDTEFEIGKEFDDKHLDGRSTKVNFPIYIRTYYFGDIAI